MMWKRCFSIIAILSMVLSSWKGYVALYEKGACEPTQVFPCPVDSLPATDQMMLEEGIPILNHHQLQQIMEDYLS